MSYRDAGKGEGLAPLLFLRGSKGGVPFYKIYFFKNEQALAEVITRVKAKSDVIV